MVSWGGMESRQSTGMRNAIPRHIAYWIPLPIFLGNPMETDPASLDPEPRQNRFLALLSISLGLISLCAAIIPICGGSASLLGLILGIASRKSESGKMANAGIAISALGLLIAVTYAAFVYLAGS